MPSVIKVAKVEKATSVNDRIRIDATLCYYYPAYTLKMARAMPHKHKMIMLSQAKRLEAQRMHNLTQIAAAPHYKKGQAVKKLLTHFSKVVKNG